MRHQRRVPFNQQPLDACGQRRSFSGVQRLNHSGRHLRRRQAAILDDIFGNNCAHECSPTAAMMARWMISLLDFILVSF